MILCPTPENSTCVPSHPHNREGAGKALTCRTLLVSMWSNDQHRSIIEELVSNAESQSPSDFLNQNLDFNTILKGLEDIFQI